MWDFETDPEYQKVLDWADEFVRDEIEPLDLAFPHQQFMPLEGKRREAIDPLKQEVRRRGLWATHLGAAGLLSGERGDTPCEQSPGSVDNDCPRGLGPPEDCPR